MHAGEVRWLAFWKRVKRNGPMPEEKEGEIMTRKYGPIHMIWRDVTAHSEQSW